MNYEDMLKMPLNTVYKGENFAITRAPGGWIYTYDRHNFSMTAISVHSIFVSELEGKLC